ncbi:hypothetical protein I6E50_11585 [Roseburia hominis]|uniref:hypothetical protein n=1 Tax=Roseburia hominis TaxID=301301 RepID=UPI001F48066A|nr:hypothetical protein [Roseburia hominis]
MKNTGEVTFTYSAAFMKNGKKSVSVRFERNDGKDFADGSLPDCIIEKQEGFSEEEVEQLEVYLMENADDILNKAKEMSKITNILK